MPAVKNETRRFQFDERQQQVIEHVGGPMLVLAGAGTGKTTVLIRRIAQLVRDGHARPEEVLALTYTDNAAREMRERVRAELRGADISGLQVATFHAYCNNLLIREGKQFGVLDDQDLWIYLRRRIRELHLYYFVRAANVSQFLDDLLDFMRRCQDELVTPAKYADYVRKLEGRECPIPRVTASKDRAKLGDAEVLERCREIASVFSTVEGMLERENLGAFGHMITRAYALLQRDAALLARERDHARFILVDEFQDANFAQVKLLKDLGGNQENVFAVGDPDQAIYRFRGASSAAFGLFQRQFPGAKLVVLENNRRSRTPILKCAFAVIQKNPPVFAERPGQAISYKRAPLRSVRDDQAKEAGQEPPVSLAEAIAWRDKALEAADVAGSIHEKQRRERGRWSDFAVLYRTHSHRDEIAQELATRGIPFSIENLDVLDTPEVRDLMACLGATVSGADAGSLFRVAALPQFAIDPEKLRAAMRSAGRDASLVSVLEGLENGPRVLQALEEVRQQVQSQKAKSRTAMEIMIRRFSLDRSSPLINAALEFVSAWEKKAITTTGTMGELQEYLGYFREAKGAITMASRDQDAVRLMTAHSAKGLEFRHVYVLRANSGSFPCHFRESLVEFPRQLRDPDSVALDEDKALHEQEERRLFYVAMTRARDSLSICAKQGTGKDSSPPGFMRELLKDGGLRQYLVQRPARPFQTDLFGSEERRAPALSNTAAWLSVEPGPDLNMQLSATGIEAYEVCPLQFKLEKVWRIPREAPAAMQYGAAMHRVLRTYYDGIRFQRPLSDDRLIELFRTDLANTRVEDRYQYELYEKQGVEQLRSFLAACRQAPCPEVLSTEEQFSIRVGQATVNGRIDRLDRWGDDGVVIVDYKTGKPRSQEDADQSLQLSVYALAVRQTWNHAVKQLVFYNLEDNSVISTNRSETQLREAQDKIEEVAAKIYAGEFEPNPGYHCNLCPYRNLCPATEKQLGLQPVKKAAGQAN